MDDHQLIATYQQLLNLQNSKFVRIDHDEAMVAIVFKITKSNGIQLILKISERPNDYLREVYFLEYFFNQLPVPRIIQIIKPSNETFGAILMEYLPGALLKITDFTNTLAYEIGSMLAKIHLNRMPGYGDPIIPNSLNSDPRVNFTLKFEEGLDECSKHLPQALIEKCRHYYEKYVNLLNSIDGPCVVHRDFRPGNLIIYNGKLKGIIDWAGARFSFAEEDFCSMEHGEWPSSSKKSFLAGYASIRPVPNYVNMMPFLRLNKTIATIGFTVKSGTWNGSNAKLYQSNRHFLDNFF
jgi:Ser/Thr protein kinase RdoA (MazF antagonist)